jgi:hypothetical protein
MEMKTRAQGTREELQISTNNGTEETLMETTTQKNTKTKTLRP